MANSFRIREDLDPFWFHRGAFIGKVEKVIFKQASKIHLPINNRGRMIRLRLASKLLDREVSSFNDLSDTELWSVEQWAIRYPEELRQWLEENYGKQEELL